MTTLKNNYKDKVTIKSYIPYLKKNQTKNKKIVIKIKNSVIIFVIYWQNQRNDKR